MSAPASPRFQSSRPGDLRRSTPWHRLSYIVAELPRRIEALAAELPSGPGTRIVDYGCADVPYRRFFAGSEYVAADLPGNPEATVEISPDGRLPLEDASADGVLSTQVLEHVRDPVLYLDECRRVLRPGGRLLLSTHGLMVYHPDPDDYWRWTCAGLRRAVERAGLRVVRFEGIMGLTATGLQLVQDAWYWRLPRPLRQLWALVLQSLIRVAERVEPRTVRELNAMVFAVVAERPPRLVGPELIAAFAEAKPDAAFVEIGANDGEQHDHLRPHILANDWRGLMVEPVPYVFERLRRNYEGVDGVTLVNAAVAEEDGRRPFYHLRDARPEERATLPDWYDGVGSLLREAVASHADQMPDIEERIVEREVEALSFDSLLVRHGLDGVDLVVIDAEGYDCEILKSVDLHRHRPRMLVYEHYHLRPADREGAREHLRAAGYETLEEGFDTFAVLPGPGDALDRAWAEAEPGVPGVSRHEEPS